MTSKVLHVIDNLDRCSVEAWLLRLLAHGRQRGVELDWTFYCSVGEAGALDEEARRLGARIVHSPVPIGRKAAFARALREELARGRYDVLHSHHDLVSGLYLAAAFGLPLRRRIVHVHNADEWVLTPSRLKQAVLKPVLRRLCLTMADLIVANSNHSLDVFLAGRARRPGRDVVHYLGIDPSPFVAASGDRAALRNALELPEDARILLFAGRMTPEKNPVFAVDVLAELRRRDSLAYGVFVGAGSLEQDVRDRSAAVGQDEAIRYMGWRWDVPEIMAASDWFILPHPEHPMEAFGVAVVEAQLAGLRLLLSRGINDDPLLPTARFRRLPLAAPAADWAQAAVELWAPAPSKAEALAALAASPMALDHALDDLIGLHS